MSVECSPALRTKDMKTGAVCCCGPPHKPVTLTPDTEGAVVLDLNSLTDN